MIERTQINFENWNEGSTNSTKGGGVIAVA